MCKDGNLTLDEYEKPCKTVLIECTCMMFTAVTTGVVLKTEVSGRCSTQLAKITT
jgi:hypothetical protein